MQSASWKTLKAELRFMWGEEILELHLQLLPEPVLWVLDLPSQLPWSHKPFPCNKHIFHPLPLVELLIIQWPLIVPFFLPLKKSLTANNIFRHIGFFFLFSSYFFSFYFFPGLRFLVVAQTYFITIHIRNYESQTISIVNPGAKLKGDPDGHAMRCQSKMGSETSLKM